MVPTHFPGVYPWLPIDLRTKPKPATRSSAHATCPTLPGPLPTASSTSLLPSCCISGPLRNATDFCSRLLPHLPTSERPQLSSPFSAHWSFPSTPCQSCHGVFAPSPACLSPPRLSAPRSEDGGCSFLHECPAYTSFSASVEWFTDMFQEPEKFQVPVVGVVRKWFLKGLPEIKLEGGTEAQGFSKL